jgi:biotin carboxyl carrier protein
MELASTAPGPGTVQSIHCAVDDQVDAGAVLVTLTLDKSAGE